MILTRSTRLIQPTGPVEIDYTNPLVGGHSFLWSAAHDVRKSLLGSQRLATVVGGYAPSTDGKSWKAASGKPVAFPPGEHFISTSDGVGTGDFTIWVIANPESSATLRDMVGQSSTASGPNSGCILIRANATAGSVTFYCGAGISAGTFDSVAASGQANGRVRLFLARRLGTELSLWVDGAKVASSSYTIRNILGAQTQTAVSVGCNPYSTSATSIHNNIMAGGANRALSDDEIASLSANPWQLFRPVQRRIYFDMGAGGGAGTSPVSSDLGAIYGIRSSVQADSASAYDVRAAVQADSGAAFDILGPVSADSTGAYTILTSALSDLGASFDVRAAVQADSGAAFLVRGSTQADASAAYLLRGSVSSDIGGTYDILNANSVSSSLSSTYVVRGAAQADVSASFDLRSSIGAISEGAFMVRGLVSSDLGASFDVQAALMPVYSDLPGSYAIDGPTFGGGLSPADIAAIRSAVRTELSAELTAVIQIQTKVDAAL